MDCVSVACRVIVYPLQVGGEKITQIELCMLIHRPHLIVLTLKTFSFIFYFKFLPSSFDNLTLYSTGKQNLTLMFNTIETRERYEEDAVEHGNQIPQNDDHKSSEKVSYK